MKKEDKKNVYPDSFGLRVILKLTKKRSCPPKETFVSKRENGFIFVSGISEEELIKQVNEKMNKNGITIKNS